jgi:glycine/D-amino acid oxidase-like deaminating enzyme
MESKMKAIVIGAGIVGSSVTYRLAEAGVDVTVLEAGRIAGGTSGTSFAWINSNNKPPRAYHDLNVAGMTAHKRIKEEFGGNAPWLHETGNLEWRTDPAQRTAQLEKVARLKSWDYPVELLSLKQLIELEPDIDPASVGDATIAFYPDEGYVDPAVYSAAMLHAARRRGAKVICGAKVVDLVTKGGRVTGTRLADGQELTADIVVNCTGYRVNEISPDAAFHIPMASNVGFLVFTPSAGTTLQRPFHADDISIRPDGAGRLMVRREDLDRAVTIDTKASPELAPAREAVRRAARILPALVGCEPEAARITIRPTPGDGHSAVGTVPGIDGFYMVITHSGVTLGAFLGAAVADEIAHNKTRPELQPFRPSRFHNQARSPSNT